MNKHDFRTWAAGKLTDNQIEGLLQLLTKYELQKFVDDWTE